MAKFLIRPTVGNDLRAKTVRLGAGTAANQRFTQGDVNKFVKLAAESRYDLCAVGDPIEAQAIALEAATQDGFSIGSIVDTGKIEVQFEGSQAAGTGAIAVGDFVVAGTPEALQTKLSTKFPKVRKATLQPFTAGASYAEVATLLKTLAFGWRVVSLGQTGTGAVGTTGIIERVSFSA
jgi:hypothetical protein